MENRAVAVIGGGVSGLVAAHHLAEQGAEVTVFEAGPRSGGQVQTIQFAGCSVDLGAESLHTAAPSISGIVGRLGLTQELVKAAPGAAWIWTKRGLRRLPAGVGPAGPTRLKPVLGARILSPLGVLRAGLEPVLPSLPRDGDISVGDFIARRFGHEISERLVDPVLGALHAGDIYELSLPAVAPQVSAMAANHRSLLLAHRARRGGPPPSFATFAGGLATLVDRLVETCGSEIRLATPVRALVPSGASWRIEGDAGTLADVDAVVLATPAQAAAGLLEPFARDAAERLRELRTASVATVVAAYPRAAAEAAAPLRGTGILVPSGSTRLMKAATLLTSKWPHFAESKSYIARLSAGRIGEPVTDDIDDDELVRRLHADLVAATGLAAEPEEVHVKRWPNALPQLEVGHLARIGGVRAELRAKHPTLVLAGASHDGIGLASCVRSGEVAADELLARLGTGTEVTT